MSELVARYSTRASGNGETTNATFTDISSPQIPNTDLIAGKKYLVLARAECETSFVDATTKYGAVGRVRLVHGSSPFAGGEMQWQSVMQINDRELFCYMTVWTAVSGEDLKFQAQADGAGHTAGYRWGSLIAIKLSDDLVENTDWRSNEDVTSVTLTTSLVTGATMTWTPPNNGDTWLVLHQATLEHDNVADDFVARLDHTGGATENWETVTGCRRAGDIRHYPNVFIGPLANVSQTFRGQVKRNGTTGSTAHRVHSFVFALNLSRFAGVTYVADDADQFFTAGDDNNWPNDIVVQNFTPPVDNGAMLVLTHCLNNPMDPTAFTGANWRHYLHRTQVDGVDLYEFPAGVNAYTATGGTTAPRYMYPQLPSLTETYPYTDFHIKSYPAVQHTYSWTGAANQLAGGSGRATKHRRVLLLSLEAIAPPTPSSGGSTYERSDQIMYVNDYVQARRRIPVRCVTTDHVSPLTTAAGTQGFVSKNGAAYTSTNVNTLVAVDAANGLYYCECNVGALDTIGSLVLRVAPTGGDVRTVTVMVEELPYVWDGGVASATASGITFASPPSFVPKGSIVRVIAGTGTGQSQIVTGYTSPTAALETTWETTPDASSKVVVLPGLPVVVPGVNVVQVNASTVAAQNLQAGAEAMLSGAVVAGTNTTTTITTNLAVAVGGVATPTDFYKGRALYFTTGALDGDVAVIIGSSVVSAKTVLVVDTLSQNPAVGDTFVIT